MDADSNEHGLCPKRAWVYSIVVRNKLFVPVASSQTLPADPGPMWDGMYESTFTPDTSFDSHADPASVVSESFVIVVGRMHKQTPEWGSLGGELQCKCLPWLQTT